VTANAAERLLQHYVDNFRRLPWRSAPGFPPPDPYRVWLSEIMLQQTTVAAVVPRFDRFVARWPSVAALAAAPDEDILSEWAGLGYYARARNLVACGREVVRRGGFPTTAAELRELPGIGDYTAAAIAAIAFGEDVPAIDTNVMRVISRLGAFKEPDRGDVERVFLAMLPKGRAGDFTQALMDLGATICRAKAPLCTSCPLSGDCGAFASGAPDDYPARKPKKARPMRRGSAYWIERGGEVWLGRRPAKGLLGGMAALPGSEWTEDAAASSAQCLANVRHLFTHFALELRVEPRDEVAGDGWWQPIGTIEHAGLPTLYRKAVAAVLEARMDRRRAA